jgi:hypothetical protein
MTAGERLRRATDAERARLRRQLVLSTIRENGPMTDAEVIERTGVTRALAQTVRRDLMRAGLVTQERVGAVRLYAATVWCLVLSAGCMVTGPEVVIPTDPEYALLCEVENPPPECAPPATAEVRIVTTYHLYPWDTIGGSR